jgi:peptidoglycan/LPS O-acetylase OafA/YrhL
MSTVDDHVAGSVDVPEPEPEPVRPPERVYVLDLLRFLAALSVVGYHLLVDYDRAWGTRYPAEMFGPLVVSPFKYGWMGVEFFFVISGFVICMSSWGRSLSEFFTSRVTRLMPAYIFAVLVTSAVLAVWPLAKGRPQPTHVLVNATMLQGFVGIPNIDSVYWTLFRELKFYVLFAIVVAFGLTYRRVVLFCVLWTTAALYAQASGMKALGVIVESTYAPYFIAGIALYLVYRFGSNLVVWGVFAVSAVLSVLSLWGQVQAQNAGRARPVASFEVAALMLACFLLVMVLAAVRLTDRLSGRWLTTLGALTYPMYLLHMQLSRVAFNRLHDVLPPWVLLLGMAAVVLTLAYATYRLVERPAAKLLRRRLSAGFAQIRSLSDPPVRGQRPEPLTSAAATIPAPRELWRERRDRRRSVG